MFRVSLGRFCFLAALSIVSVLVFSLALDAEAAEGINRQIPFQGTLKSVPSGRPVTGTRDMVFKIYDVPTGGVALWTGNHTAGNGNAVTVDDGVFSVMLGSGTGNEMTLDFTSDTYYLGVTVGTDPEMAPRERLGASPYAFNADFLDGLTSTQFLRVNNPLAVATSTDTALLSLTQSGMGNFASFRDGSDTELFSVLSTGEVFATKFQNTADDVNTFLGWLDVYGSEPSYFGAGLSTDENITVADGTGISFGNGNGILMYQDASVPDVGTADLVLAGIGPNETGYVNITSAGGIWLTPNNFNGCTDGCEPSLKLNETGSIEMSNMTYGDLGERQLRLNFEDGVVVTSGDFTVSAGNVVFESGNLTLPTGSIRVENGNLQADNLADAPELIADSQGNIVPGPSDERLKENIRTINGALETVLDLRGVQYEWRDKERFGERTEVGFVAQEVEDVLPEVVRDTGEYLSVNTKNIVAVVVEAVKEMYGEMRAYMSRTEALEREVEALREEVEALRGRSLPIESAEPEPAPEEVTLDDEEETPVVPVEGPEPTVEASEPPAPSPAEIVE